MFKNQNPLDSHPWLLDVGALLTPFVMSLPTYFVLRNGIKIPSVGFGISSAAPFHCIYCC
jgi:hypothetical protein